MRKDQARNLVKKTLEKPFDKVQFGILVKNLLNKMDEEKSFVYKGNTIPKDFQFFVKTFERIGKYKDPEDKIIDILIVKLQKETSLERARAAQRRLISKYLNGSRGGVLKDGALVAFVSPDGEDWRFSFVKIDYRFDEQGKIKDELTPARRYSFLVGKNESSHTAQSALVPRLQNDDQNPSLKDLEDAFSVEKVTKEFFEKYRALFHKLKEAMDEIIEKDKKIKAEFESKGIKSSDFSKKLLGQIVFLYFLQKKGWFGVKRGAEWGTGSKHFLRELFNRRNQRATGVSLPDKGGKGGFPPKNTAGQGDFPSDRFFNDILEPLFYEALAAERADDYYSRFDCRIPFLNGGLFEPLRGYDWVNTDIFLPDSLFSNKNQTKEGDSGDGILDVFDRYNFTVNEDEPLEKEVAVDPEMLGKVFENLLEVKDRKSKGTYYTPREIVHYMCQESLINYLAEELKGKVEKEEIEEFIKISDSSVEHDKIHLEKTAGNTKYKGRYAKSKLPDKIRENAGLTDEKLAEIRVCDPAVGSGAFPVGMMNEIVRARTKLNSHIEIKDSLSDKKGSAGEVGSRTPYHFKRHAIERCLYGADIDSGAVEIAKLRLWLSLVVDEEEREKVQPLPNLDYKMVCGNSLLGLNKDDGLGTKDAFYELNLKKFHKKKELYFNETSAFKKQKLKEEIDQFIDKITEGKKLFDFEIYFSEIFKEKGGFDIVIANPPYVSYGLRGGQKMLDSEKSFLRKNFQNSAEYKISLYAVFMEKGLQIARPNGGFETYIIPDSFLLGRYFSKIRNHILKTSEIIYILLLPFNVFNATVGFSVVYLLKRRNSVNPKHKFSSQFISKAQDIDSEKFKKNSYLQSYFSKQKHHRFRLYFSMEEMKLILKIENESQQLKDMIKISSGLISKTGQKDIISESKKKGKWLPGIISGSEIKKYVTISDGRYILYDDSQIKSGFKNVNYFDEKIFIRQTGDSLVCSFDNKGLLALNNVHIGNALQGTSLKYIVAILNSHLMNFYYQTVSLEKGRAMAQIDIETVEGLPVKSVGLDRQKPLIDLVDKILAITKTADYSQDLAKQAQVKEYEKQIDQFVYKLYNLTLSETKVIEKF